MPILPEEIATATFTRVHRQGYHTGEVDAFLRAVAADYGAALEKMLLTPTEPAELDVGEEVNAILRAARASASALLQRAQEDAEALQKAATEKAQEIETQASQARVAAFEQSVKEAGDLKSEAERYSQDLRQQAEDRARQLVDTAEARAQELFAYNQKLSEHLAQIERLVAGLRAEVDAPLNEWPDQPSARDSSERDRVGAEEDGPAFADPEMMLQDESV